MKTDQPIYLYLSAGPEAFRVLTGGLTLAGPYRFSSITLKGLERRLDGLCEPEDPEQPAYALEFQGQGKDATFYNLLTKMGLYGERHPRRDVQGIAVFLRAADAPAFPRRITGEGSPIRAVFLDQVLPEWLAREPDNPYVAVLAPLVIATDAELRQRAPDLWQSVQTAAVPDSEREALAEVLLFWLMERFRTLTKTEVLQMLNLLTSIEDTSGYQAIKELGIAEGKAEGKAEDLTRLLTRRFGPLPAWSTGRISAAPIGQLDAWLDGILDAPSLTDLIGPESEAPH